MMESSVDESQYTYASPSEIDDDDRLSASEHLHDNSDNDSASDSVASSVHSHIGSSVTLLSAFEDDASMLRVCKEEQTILSL